MYCIVFVKTFVFEQTENGIFLWWRETKTWSADTFSYHNFIVLIHWVARYAQNSKRYRCMHPWCTITFELNVNPGLTELNSLHNNRYRRNTDWKLYERIKEVLTASRQNWRKQQVTSCAWKRFRSSAVKMLTVIEHENERLSLSRLTFDWTFWQSAACCKARRRNDCISAVTSASWYILQNKYFYSVHQNPDRLQAYHP